MLFLITGKWIRRSYPEEYDVSNFGNKEVNRMNAFLKVRFRVLNDQFGSRMMNGITKEVAQGFIVALLFGVMMIPVTSVMMMMVNFSFLMVMRYKAMNQRK